MKKIIYGLISIITLAVTLTAAPTIKGPTGLIVVPTAESLKYKEFNVSMDYNYDPLVDKLDWFYKVNLGTFKNWELGIVGGVVPTEGVYVNAKYYLMSDNTRYPLSIALGFQGLSSLTESEVYLVASKKFQDGIRVHLGFTANFSKEEITPSVMGGLEYFLSNQTSILTDITGEEKIYLLNAGIRHEIFQDIYVRAAAIDILNENQDITYSFGMSYSHFL